MVICEYYAVSADDAVDILNEGFLEIFKQVANYSVAHINNISSFTGWLRTTMLQAAIGHTEGNRESWDSSSSAICV